MISVLIPTYNYVCYNLVWELQRQLSASNEKYEIIKDVDSLKDLEKLVREHDIFNVND